MKALQDVMKESGVSHGDFTDLSVSILSNREVSDMAQYTLIFNNCLLKI